MARRGSRTAGKSKKAQQRKQGRVEQHPEADRPTPEMRARVEYVFGPVSDEMGAKIGAAYHRQPLYVTMAKKPDRFTYDELSALRLYRSVFDRSERSPVASCLAAQHGGGRGVGPAGFIHASPAIVEARRKLTLIERNLGHTLPTMRAFVLLDQSFSAIAIERFGHRTRSWISVSEPVMRDGKPVKVDGKPVLRAAHREDIVPRSGRDRERVAAEFNRGVKLLADAVSRLSGADVDEVWVHPRQDGSAIIHRASIAPNNLFRLWGPAPIVAAVIDTLLEKNADTLVFNSPEAARDALVAADAGRLHCLEPGELAR